MPAVAVTCAAATTTLVTEKLNAKIKPKAIIVDNVLAGVDAVLTFNDVFTPSITNAVPIPVLTTIPRIYINVPTGVCQSIMDFIDQCEFVGTPQVVRGILDANCRITFIYDFV